MPTYTYKCFDCDYTEEVNHPYNKRVVRECPNCCFATLTKLPGMPAIRNLRFTSNLDDGFTDDFSRKLCLKNAKAAGINTAGKVYVPGLAEKGKGLGRTPQAWTEGTREEIEKFCRENHKCAEGAFDFDGGTIPEEEPKPYRVNEKLVEQDVTNTCLLEDIRPEPKKIEAMKEEARHRLSGE